VIVLTLRREEVHWVRLLECGGDDVMVKPFPIPSCAPGSPRCCGAPMPRQPRPVLSAGPVRIDVRDRCVTVDDRAVDDSASPDN
jgi:DNA-binding response OmpR family regulator